MSTVYGHPRPTAVASPKNTPAKSVGLVLLSLICSPLALYLDGASTVNVVINFILWLNLLWLISVPWAIGYVLRSEENRNMSRPWRYSLWVHNREGYAPHSRLSNNGTPSPKQTTSNADASYKHTDQAETNPFKDSRTTL